MIKPGDILLFKGNTPILSSLIRRFTHSEYTHVGLAVTKDWVYEIDLDRKLAIHPIRSDAVYDIYRLKEGLTKNQEITLRFHALEKAKHTEGYDFLKVISLFFEKLFRFPFTWDDLNREICSEIVDRLYATLEIDLVPNRATGHVTPADISRSPLLIQINSL